MRSSPKEKRVAGRSSERCYRVKPCKKVSDEKPRVVNVLLTGEM
jgi:hypothetical protein